MTALAEAELIMNDHDGPDVIPGRYAGPAIPISTGPTPQQIAENARKAAADRLAGQICAAAAISAQATCTLLELVAEFDATGAIRYWTDLKSVAHWLAWSCSMTPGVAREHVRVARALPKMPTVHAAFRAGRLSYSKVREISRVVDIIDDTKLCQMATTATAAQLATTISAYRSTEHRRIGQQAQRRVTWHRRDDGMVDLRARLTQEDAAILAAAIHAAQDQYGTIPTKPDPTAEDQTTDDNRRRPTGRRPTDTGRRRLHHHRCPHRHRPRLPRHHPPRPLRRRPHPRRRPRLRRTPQPRNSHRKRSRGNVPTRGEHLPPQRPRTPRTRHRPTPRLRQPPPPRDHRPR